MRRSWFCLVCCVGIVAVISCGSLHSAHPKPVPTEHGWETSRVIATRHHNEQMGWFVGLDFPRNVADADREEVSDYLENYGGSIFQGGGYPGAIAYTSFENVNTKEALNRKILEILPGLDKLMEDMANGTPVHITKVRRRLLDKHGKEWPECIPPDPADPWGEFNNNMSVNGTPYKCSGQGQWVIDPKGVEFLAREEDARFQLVAALGARKLTKSELQKLDSSINVPMNTSFSACDQLAELYDLLVKQWELQTGTKADLYAPLSTAKAEYNRCPQEDDNRRAVEALIKKLRAMRG